MQVGALVLGHVAGLVLAHDRALKVFPDPREATRSQYWMLVVMVAFTSLGLWLLSVGDDRWPPLAHAGHWIASLLYVAPVAVIVGALLWQSWRSDGKGAARAKRGKGADGAKRWSIGVHACLQLADVVRKALGRELVDRPADPLHPAAVDQHDVGGVLAAVCAAGRCRRRPTGA